MPDNPTKSTKITPPRIPAIRMRGPAWGSLYRVASVVFRFRQSFGSGLSSLILWVKGTVPVISKMFMYLAIWLFLGRSRNIMSHSPQSRGGHCRCSFLHKIVRLPHFLLWENHCSFWLAVSSTEIDKCLEYHFQGKIDPVDECGNGVWLK